MGAFRLVSTDNGIPTKDDLIKVLDRGMPGTPMASWPQLSQREKRGLAELILGFRRDELIAEEVADGASRAEARQTADEELSPGQIIDSSPAETEHSAHVPQGMCFGARTLNWWHTRGTTTGMRHQSPG